MTATKSLFLCALCATASVLVAGCGDKNKNERAADVGKPGVAKATEAASENAEITDETVVAEVDGEKLTYGEAMKTVKRMLGAQGAPADQVEMIAKQVAPQALPEIANQFVSMALLKAEAVAKGFSATMADIDEAVSNFVANLPENVTFADVLEREGLTEEEARKRISEDLTIKKLVDELTKDLKADEEAVAKFYKENPSYFEKTPEQVEASHILIKVDAADATNETVKTAAKAKAENLRAQILAGTNFADLASAHSDCPSKAQGGSLGFFRRGQMVKPFDDVAFALGTNEVSEVVETQFGFHVIKVTGKIPGEMISFEEARDDIAEYLIRPEKGKKAKELVDELKTKAKVFINEAVTKAQAPAIPMSEEDLNAAMEAVPASEPVAIESAPVEVKPAEAPAAEEKPTEEAPAPEAPAAEEKPTEEAPAPEAPAAN